MEQLLMAMIDDAMVDVERAECWLQRAEEARWMAEINRTGWQSDAPWVNDELEAAVRHEEGCVRRARQYLARLCASLG